MAKYLEAESPLLHVEAAARLLGVHGNTLRRWTNAGHIAAYIINSRGDRRYSRKVIREFLEAGATRLRN